MKTTIKPSDIYTAENAASLERYMEKYPEWEIVDFRVSRPEDHVIFVTTNNRFGYISDGTNGAVRFIVKQKEPTKPSNIWE